MFVAGFFLYKTEKESLSAPGPETAVYSCILSDFPEEKRNTFMITAEMKSMYSPSVKSLTGSLLIYIEKDEKLKSWLPGDELILRCALQEITNRGNPYEFDYKFFMENQGIKYFALIKSADILSHKEPERRKLRHAALITRNGIIQIYRKSGVPEKQIPLVSAITLGEKSGLDQEQKQNFIKAGIMHIMAVSGLHAVLLSLFVFNVLFFLKGRFNILRIILTLLFLWAFAFVTGLTPSVMRATLMFSFLQAGTLMHRKVNGINSVLASAFILILLKPSVIFDAGFLLSYSAVIYIIAFYQTFYRKLECRRMIPDKIWQSAAVTIIAQLGTLPLTIMLFNRFPTYFILTNIVIVPISSLVIIAGCLVPVFYPIHSLSHLSGWALGHLTGLTELLTKKAAALPLSNIENIGITTPECIFLTGMIFLLTKSLLESRKKLFYPLLFLLLYTATSAITEISVRRSNELIVYNTIGGSEIGIRTGKRIVIYSDSLRLMPDVAKHCSTLGLKASIRPFPETFTFLRAGEKKILIYRKGSISPGNEPNILIINGYPSENLSFGTDLQALILASGNKLPANVSLPHTDTIHIIRKSGAFRTPI
jgi:competence protein ComEC